MIENEAGAEFHDEVPLWFHDGLYGKIKATALNNYIGVFEAGKWYTIHYMQNNTCWVYRLDDASDEETARANNNAMILEGDYPVLASQVFICTSVVSPTQTIVHHTPTEKTNPVLFTVEGTLGPINVNFTH